MLVRSGQWSCSPAFTFPRQSVVALSLSSRDVVIGREHTLKDTLAALRGKKDNVCHKRVLRGKKDSVCHKRVLAPAGS
jgi:hypothetical protein